MSVLTRNHATPHVRNIALLLLLASCGNETKRELYSRSGSESSESIALLEFRDSIAFRELARFGNRGGSDMFGHITGAAFGSGGAIYVSDSKYARVAVFDSLGKLRRYIGARGTAIGGLQSPVAVTSEANKIVVYDAGLRAVVVFDTSGAPLATIAAPESPTALDVRVLNNDAIIVPGGDSGAAATAYSLSKHAKLRHFGGGVFRSGSASTVRPAGRICRPDANHLLFMNPEIYQVLSFQTSNGDVDWERNWQSEVVKPRRRGAENGLGVTPRAALLGVTCTPSRFIVAYLDRTNMERYYDVFDERGNPLSRLRYDRNDPTAPGFAADMRSDRLITFRTKPVNEVTLYALNAVRSPSRAPEAK